VTDRQADGQTDTDAYGYSANKVSILYLLFVFVVFFYR